MDVYADAELYELEFAGRKHEIPFYLTQARLANGPVLEVGCGTGRLTLPIARTNVDITGLDVSRPMLELAQRKAEKEQLKVTWLERDCRNIGSSRMFTLIFSAANAMQHLHDLESVNAFLTSARSALDENGSLILDVFNPDAAKLSRPATTRYHHKNISDSAGSEIRVEISSNYHSATQILVFTLFYLQNGVLIRQKTVRMRCFYPEELLAICRFNGLEVVNRYGDYDEQPFSDNSPKQILICKKAMRGNLPA